MIKWVKALSIVVGSAGLFVISAFCLGTAAMFLTTNGVDDRWLGVVLVAMVATTIVRGLLWY